MYLVISKRFEISLSYRYWRREWTPQKNRTVFGRNAGSEHGLGGNFVASFVYHGPVDPESGMIINVTVIKDRVGELLNRRYDHKYLNVDTLPFDEVVPTPENVARQLFEDTYPLFDDEPADLVACHLETSPFDSATAFAGGQVERHHWLEFSAARRTFSPHLSDEENERAFGTAASRGGHGHFYRMRVTLHGDPDPEHGMIFSEPESRRILDDLHALLDHRNLSSDVSELQGVPMTTEYLAKFLHRRLGRTMPVDRVRLWENPYLSAEYLADGHSLMALETAFRAAHRLHNPCLTDSANRATYGKCNNPSGHGHLYRVETTLAGRMDERTGMLFSLDCFHEGLDRGLAPWRDIHLDLGSDDFRDRPSTGENIVRTLWPRLESALDHELHRLRLWETPNNRFTLRRAVEAPVPGRN